MEKMAPPSASEIAPSTPSVQVDVQKVTAGVDARTEIDREISAVDGSLINPMSSRQTATVQALCTKKLRLAGKGAALASLHVPDADAAWQLAIGAATKSAQACRAGDDVTSEAERAAYANHIADYEGAMSVFVSSLHS